MLDSSTPPSKNSSKKRESSNSNSGEINSILATSVATIEKSKPNDERKRCSQSRSDRLMNGARWIGQGGNEPRRGASIGSLDVRGYTCPHTNIRWRSCEQASAAWSEPDDLGACACNAHGTLCCREPLITDAESISISRSITTCDAVYANRTRSRLAEDYLATDRDVRACMRASTDLRILCASLDLGHR